MSDYDEGSDYGDEWLYIEEDVTAADDLAEQAVPSPPPTAFGDDEFDLDAYDYYIDLEYGEEFADDTNFNTQQPEGSRGGGDKKRKRGTTGNCGKKRAKLRDGLGVVPLDPRPQCPPVVWLSRAERVLQPKMLLDQDQDDEAEPYALLKDWRERFKDAPSFQAASLEPETNTTKHVSLSDPELPTLGKDHGEAGDEDEDEAEEKVGIDPSVLMEALQRNLAVAGGPLGGMDPEQLIQFAMRMMDDPSAGDDIAGELAKEMLAQGGNDEDDVPVADDDADHILLDADDDFADADTGPQETIHQVGVTIDHNNERPPASPISTDNGCNDDAKTAPTHKNPRSLLAKKESPTLKRKADTEEEPPKKRVTRSFDAPTAASQARAAASKTARDGRPKRK